LSFFANLPLPFVFVASLVLFGAAAEIGHGFGLRDRQEANIATLQASILGLLALMLSFTFAMAVSRFDDRRGALLDEANAIGTAALRARLLPAPHDATSLNLLRDYVGIRTALTTAFESPAPIETIMARSNALQEALWKEARAVASKDAGMVPTGLFIQALNDVFDAQEKRLTAFRNRVPRIVFFALYGIAAVGIGFSGYASGLERRRWRLPVYIVSLLAASVVLLIQDIDRPDSGWVLVDPQPLIDAAETLANYRIDPKPAPPTAR
jgi:hypothetical protein